MTLVKLNERLGAGPPLLIDGAMGTELQRRGVPMDGVAWCAAALDSHADAVRAVHEDYAAAGAEIMIANTFAASPHVLAAAGLGSRTEALNRRAVELARQAVDRAAPDHPVWVAGSISAFAAGNDPDRRPSGARIAQAFADQATMLADAGADLIALEMVDAVDDGIAAVEAARATGLPVWVGFSCRADDAGEDVLMYRRGTDVPFAPGVEQVMAAGGDLAAIMHSDVDVTVAGLEVLRDAWSGPIAAYPHSGHFVMPEWQFDAVIDAESFAAEAQKWVDLGVRAVGGCCGIGPDHIRALAARL